MKLYEELTAKAVQSIKNKFGVKNVSVDWERPLDPAYGDLTSSVALRLSKRLKEKPDQIARCVKEGIRHVSGVAAVDVVAPGYVNVHLTPDALIAQLSRTREACTAKTKRVKETPIIVEYSGPNIAKPLGAHHLLTTLIGQVIVNLYRHQGCNVISWNYMGDWGTQFGKLAVAMEKWGDGRPATDYSVDELLRLYVRFHQESEKNPALEDRARDAFRALEAGDRRVRSFWKAVVATTKAELTEIYGRMHVSFDMDKSESFYEDKMAAVLREGAEKKVFVQGEEGALIVDFEDMPPYLVRKGDGSTLYSTRDIAQMKYRIDTYHPQMILIVTDVAQKLHFEQLEATCRKLCWELPLFEHVVSGRMRFSGMSMSTRKGNVFKLKEVLEEAVKRAKKVIAEHEDAIRTDDADALAEMMGIGAVAYGVLSQNRRMDVVFDWEKFLSFNGNSAPYLQYTYARARSVLSKADASSATQLPTNITTLSALERALICALLQFSDVLNEARETHMPHKLANYLHRLCQNYNVFYNAEPILKADEPTRSLRLFLTSLAASVLKTGADLLTIRVPERM